MEREHRDWFSTSARRNLSLTGICYRADGANLRVLVSNLSYEGCNLLCGQRLIVGEMVKVAVPGLSTVEAQVRWTADEKAGLSFLVGKSALEESRAEVGR